MPKKSNKTLAKRMEALKEKGFDPFRCSMTMAEIAEVVGDLTFEEFDRMCGQERARLYVAGVSAVAHKGGRSNTDGPFSTT
jgi:hypothetical protein